MATAYRGRFAPSPTGPLHLGSLIAALASYLDARSHEGTWLVRMEDLDPPREQAGAAASILQSLECHGLHWDEPVLWQSQRSEAYEHALDLLASHNQTFCCNCTRQTLSATGSCQAHCIDRQAQITPPHAVRLRITPGGLGRFNDLLQQPSVMPPDEQIEDFVVKRKDGLYAYQLAVVVDDADQEITHIVRGSDLISSTPRQIYLQGILGKPTPHYSHLPVITNAEGQKYSKQNHAPRLDDLKAGDNLRKALAFLQQDEPPADLRQAQEILAFACQHWSIERVPGVPAIAAQSLQL